MISCNTNDALWVIDGVIAFNDAMKKVNPQSIESVSVLRTQNAAALYGEKGKNGVILITTKKNFITEPTKTVEPIKEKSIADEVYTKVSESPAFPGGVKEMYPFIAKNLKYPEEAKRNNIKGKVFIKFIVRKDGSISDISILQGIGYGCEEEAMRIIEMMPKWNPGKQNGVPVNTYFTMPIAFILE
ncbi:MAG: TonB family protein [Emticicia sp.]|nr:TonB family protein [Emticicia sp.]